MSLYQTGPPRPRVLAKALVAPAPVLDTGLGIVPVLDTGFAIVRAESLLAVGTHRVADLLFVFGLVILPMAAMITLPFLLSSADPSTAVPLGALDGTGMLILPP
jgi:hypothetical protein